MYVYVYVYEPKACLSKLHEQTLYPIDQIMCDEDVVERLGGRPQKKQAGCKEPDWQPVHQECFDEYHLKWPVSEAELHSSVSGVETFRQREAELCYAADKVFAVLPERYGKWSFFDCNATLQRAVHYPVDRNKKLVNPWKYEEQGVPCQTGSAVMCARL